jgi:3-methylfumaryl-CoA hydratase
MNTDAFVGRQETHRDVADPQRMARLAATLDHVVSPWQEGVLPPLGHWLCFQPDAPASLIGPDGHPVRTNDGMLPNVDLPRRMWAGSRLRFLRAIPLGARIVRRSTLVSATAKNARSGRMLLVTVHHEIAVENCDTAIIEDQDIVYREAAVPGAAAPRPAVESGAADAVVRTATPDAVMLFRYSALTFNSHRIHYDRDYCRSEEGYPGLVVQGPLLATLLLDHLLCKQPGARLASYSFRAMSPIFDGEPVTLGLGLDEGNVRLRAIGPAGVAMSASAELLS